MVIKVHLKEPGPYHRIVCFRHPFWTEYLQADGALRKILQALQSFFHLQPVIMLTVQFLLSTVDGWVVKFFL